MSFIFRPRRRSNASTWIAAVSAALWIAGAVTPASAQLLIDLEGTQIFDGGAGDLDFIVNDKIDFSGIYGLAQYQVQGTLRLSPPWPVGQSLTGMVPPIVGSLTLTNFVAEALITSTLNQTLTVRIRGDVLGTFGGGTAIDSIDAAVGSSSFTPVPPGTDVLWIWQTAIFDNSNYVSITPPTGAPLPQGNPNHPGAGTTPYLTSGNGPIPHPGFVNPTIDGMLVFSLGNFDDQFILPNSAEIGFTPEPGAAAVMLTGLAISAFARRRRGASRTPTRS